MLWDLRCNNFALTLTVRNGDIDATCNLICHISTRAWPRLPYRRLAGKMRQLRRYAPISHPDQHEFLSISLLQFDSNIFLEAKAVKSKETCHKTHQNYS